MKKILVGILFSVASVAALETAAQRPRWVETDRWSGRGTRATETFRINTATWRLVYTVNEQRLFHVRVHDAQANHVASIRPLNGPDTERMIFRDTNPGEYFLNITTVDADWTVAVHQYLSTIEEWQLIQERQTPAPALRRVAEYTGIGGIEQFTIEIDKPHSKLQWQFGEPGVFEFIIQKEGEQEPVYRTFLTEPGTYQNWLHQPGKFTLRIEAAETGPWNMTVAVPEEKNGK